MALVVPVDRVPPVADMAAGSSEVSHTDCAMGPRIHSLPEEAHHRMEHNWPEVAASTLDSFAVRIVAVRMVMAGRTDLVGREGRVKHCEDRHLPGGKNPDCHFVEERASFLSLLSNILKFVVFCCVRARSCRL